MNSTHNPAFAELKAQIENMPNITVISRAEVIGTIEDKPVYARMSDGSEVRVGAIAWTTFAEYSTGSDYRILSVDDVHYFFTKN